MTSQQRKENSGTRLTALHIPTDYSLPAIDDSMYKLRSPQEVGKRILILTYLNCVASEPSLQQEVMMFLIREKLWDDVTPDEKVLFHKTKLGDEDIDGIFWRKETIWMLLWVTGQVDDVGTPDHEVDLYEIFPLLPGFFESTEQFLRQIDTRDNVEIFAEQDFYFRLNWSLRSAPNHETSLVPGVVHERDVALSWLTGILEEWI